MPIPLSNELRSKIIQHKQNGEKESDIAKWLVINKSTVTKIWKAYRERNTIEPKPHKKGRKPAFDNETMNKITTKIKEQPDITLEELVGEFNLNISISALCRKLQKLDLTRKKRRYSVKNNSVPTWRGCGASG